MGIGAAIAGVGSIIGGAAQDRASRRAQRAQRRGAERGEGFIRDATIGARGELEEGFGLAEQDLLNAFSEALGIRGTGLEDELAALTGQTGLAIDALRGGEQRGIESLLSGLTGLETQLNPFAQGGQQALQQELALTGSLGPEAQQAAIDAFVSSPGQEALRQSGERSIARQAAATGGLGGGALLADLQDFGSRFQQQDLQQRLANLSGISGRGQQAASMIGQGSLGTGQSIADLIRATSGAEAGFQGNLGAQLANALRSGTQDLTGLVSNRGAQLGNLRTGLASNLAQLLLGQGTSLANINIGQAANDANQIMNRGNIFANTIGNLAGIGGMAFGGGNTGGGNTGGSFTDNLLAQLGSQLVGGG